MLEELDPHGSQSFVGPPTGLLPPALCYFVTLGRHCWGIFFQRESFYCEGSEGSPPPFLLPLGKKKKGWKSCNIGWTFFCLYKFIIHRPVRCSSSCLLKKSTLISSCPDIENFPDFKNILRDSKFVSHIQRFQSKVLHSALDTPWISL